MLIAEDLALLLLDDAKGTWLLDGSPTGDPVLDEAQQRVGAKGTSRAESLLGPVAKGLEEELLARLAAAGAVERREETVWKIFPRTTHPAADPTQERSVRDRVASALRGGRADDERTAALVALLSASGTLTKVVDPASVGVTKKELEAAGKAVAADDRIAGSVRRALESLDAAMMMAVMTPVIVTTSN